MQAVVSIIKAHGLRHGPSPSRGHSLLTKNLSPSILFSTSGRGAVGAHPTVPPGQVPGLTSHICCPLTRPVGVRGGDRTKTRCG